MTNPLIEKMRVEMRFKRIRRTPISTCAAENPGAITFSMIGLAKIATIIESKAVVKKAILRMLENRSQAFCRPSLVSTSLKTGMKAMASAPPEISMKSMSGRLLAALNTSNSAERPNWREITIWRSTPKSLSMVNKTASSSDTFVIRLNFFIRLPIIQNVRIMPY